MKRKHYNFHVVEIGAKIGTAEFRDATTNEVVLSADVLKPGQRHPKISIDRLIEAVQQFLENEKGETHD